MSQFKLFFKSILYYWKINVASVLATALCVAIIAGALIIGDSIKFSLNQITSQRLGKTAYILNAGDKLVRQQLASDLAGELNTNASPLLQAQGTASVNGGENSANRVQINGIDSSFMNFAPQIVNQDIPAYDEIFINTKLAEKLELKPDDFILLKIRKHDDVPLNSPFISTDSRFVSLFVQVKKILSDDEFGRFSLRNDQVSPYNAFLNINQLNELLEQKGAANIILIETEKNLNIANLQKALKKVWELSDASLSIRDIGESNQIEILSDQIFIGKPIIDAVNSAGVKSDLIFTYLVNSIEHQENSTPYSFVSSLQSLNLKENEIIINQWLANDLKALKNDTVFLNYYTIGPLRILSEKSKGFIVKDIVGFDGFATDETLMPPFPGLANVDNCRDWNTGVNIDLEKIRDKDENYWDEHKGTPKAFISYDSAREIWENDFGLATSMRFSSTSSDIDSLGYRVLRMLNPSFMGLQFIPVQQQGLTAASNSVDFGQLFLGMSFFILVSALLLISLFFYLNTEYRNKEMGLYMSAGFKKKSIKRIWLSEGLIIIIIGSFIGLAGAIFYNKLLLNAINTVWLDMVKTNILFIKIYPQSLAIGWISGAACAFLSLYFSLTNKLKKSIVSLQKNYYQTGFANDTGKRKLSLVIFYISIAAIVVFTAFYLLDLLPDISIVFFIYGILLLIIGISGFDLILRKAPTRLIENKLSFLKLCTTNLSKNKKRSLLIVTMLAIGVYLVISTGANRQYMVIDSNDPKSGTGGFLYYAQTTLPVIDDLSTHENRLKYGLEKADSLNVDILQLNTLDGDEASCFNLNQIRQPRLLGVDYNKLANKNAFSFAKIPDTIDKENPWASLGINFDDNTYPAIADQTVIQWSFGKTLGDTLFFQKENGDTVNLVLIAGLQNSIFQGNLLISNSVFRKLYPSIPGSKVFLINGQPERKEEIQNLFNRNFRDYGIEITSAPERLASFYSVQNTYLNVFVLLGGIGLIIGTLGIGILIFRSVLDRKQELGILRAVGFKKTRILKILLTENLILLFSGIVIGTLSAIISTLPSFLAAGTQIPLKLIVEIMVLLVVFGLMVVFISIVFSTRRNLVEILKSE